MLGSPGQLLAIPVRRGDEAVRFAEGMSRERLFAEGLTEG